MGATLLARCRIATRKDAKRANPTSTRPRPTVDALLFVFYSAPIFQGLTSHPGRNRGPKNTEPVPDVTSRLRTNPTLNGLLHPLVPDINETYSMSLLLDFATITSPWLMYRLPS